MEDPFIKCSECSDSVVCEKCRYVCQNMNNFKKCMIRLMKYHVNDIIYFLTLNTSDLEDIDVVYEIELCSKLFNMVLALRIYIEENFDIKSCIGWQYHVLDNIKSKLAEYESLYRNSYGER